MADTSTVPPSGTQTQIRRLRRSRKDRVIGGVCGGLGRYFDVDPVLLRIAAVALALSGGVGLLAYLIGWIVIPEEAGDEAPYTGAPSNRHGTALIVGAALIAFGALLFVREFVPWFTAGVFWPLVVVSIGVFILASARR